MDSCIGKREILVVDDDSSMRELLVDVLSSEGFEGRTAANGKLAMQSVATLPPHMILMDINMPDMDGIEVLRRLKAQEANFSIPMIFVSGVFVSTQSLPPQLRVVSYLTPLTYAVDALREATIGPSVMFIVDLVALLAWFIAFQSIAVIVLARTTSV